MTLLDRLAASDAPVVMDLIAAHAPHVPAITGTIAAAGAVWDNRPTWDNWQKSPAPFDNRPTWDNWNKKK
ncbi:multiple cyclophane-containing RiPP AmcA [Streptomyces sp. NPDC093252]|uniref:multiple cyclophane-containing RiPP AmcA n=1 Tax=Streptomyces sp. NPDC093252 TaxID=3154980 RepID=UPI003428D56D